MKLKQLIGIGLMIFMGNSLWDKFQESLKGTDEPFAMGALLVTIMLILLFLVFKVLRD